MTPARPVRFAAAAMATAGAVLLSAAPAHPLPHASPAALPSAAADATEPTDTAPAAPAPPAAPNAASGRSVGELLAALKVLYGERERASEAYRRAAHQLHEQQKRTDRLERRLAGTRYRLAEEREIAARVARAQYRTGAPGLPTAVQVLLADDPVVALRHGHTLERAAARQQATVRALASGERHRGAVAAQARDALQRQQKLADRAERKREASRAAMREVERMLTSLTPQQLAALRDHERKQARLSPP